MVNKKWRVINIYTLKQIRHAIERYQELRCVTQVSACRYEQVRFTGGNLNCASDTLCLLIDLDRAVQRLTARQQSVIYLLEQGYAALEISKKLNISIATIKFHLQAAINKISTYLNYL